MADTNIDVLVNQIIEALGQISSDKTYKGNDDIPVGVSNRHLHLSQSDMDVLFGKDYSFTPIKDLTQPGQFACKETVTICGPKGSLEKIRVLGPARSDTQVEILAGDTFKLGIKAPVKMSGEVDGTPGITIIGPKGSVIKDKGVMVAQRHIHMTLKESEYYGVKDGQIVDIKIDGPRGGIISNVIVRANDSSALECHLDTEEANALGITSSSKIKIVK